MTTPCIKLPDFPTLPDITPLTFELPPLPSIDLSVDFCCKLALSIHPEIPQEVIDAIKLVLLEVPDVSPTIALINQQILKLNSLIDALPLSCPLEDEVDV